MSSLRRLVSIAIGLCFVLLLGVSPAAATPGPEPEGKAPNVDPTVRCQPSSVSAPVGQTVSIDLYVQDVTNLYGTDMRVSFDPTIGQVVDQDPLHRESRSSRSTVGSSLASSSTAKPIRLRTSRRIAVRGVSGMQPPKRIPPCRSNNSGPVARITFLGLQVGTFPMNWINAQLSAPGGVPITPVITQPCTVTFYDPSCRHPGQLRSDARNLDRVLVAWETASEIGNRGFNLYRGTTPAAPEQQLNALLIPSQAPGSGQGYAYTWQDFDVTAGTDLLLLARDGQHLRRDRDARAGQRDDERADRGDAGQPPGKSRGRLCPTASRRVDGPAGAPGGCSLGCSPPPVATCRAKKVPAQYPPGLERSEVGRLAGDG